MKTKPKPKPEPTRFVRMFKPQFAPLVKSGVKCQTVRPLPARMPKAGDFISLRVWKNKPYRSPQVVLKEATITEVKTVEIGFNHIAVDQFHLTPAQQDAFAKSDGFQTSGELMSWFHRTHGLPFNGVVIKWATQEQA